MLTIKNRLVFGLIKGIIKGVVKLLLKIIELFSLQFALIVLIFGGALYLSGGWNSVPLLQFVFYFLFIASIVFAIVSTVRRLLGFGKKKGKDGDGSVADEGKGKNKKSKRKKKKGAELEQQALSSVENGQSPTLNAEMPTASNGQTDLTNDNAVAGNYAVEEKPVYYAVKNQPNYVMAEYSDRYELYLKTTNGLQRVRVDYKG